jgi:iron complex transport system substrate-binding protein
MPCGLNLDKSLELTPSMTALPGFDLLPCAENARVVAVDGSAFFNRPGPRITQSIRIIATAVRARNGDAAPEGAAYWNQPATSRTALMTPRPL